MKNIFFLLIICFFSCEYKVEDREEGVDYEENIRGFVENENYYLLLKKAINEGDTVSYDAISKMRNLKADETDFFYYSFIMSHKYNYGKAYYDLFKALKYKEITINGVEVYSNDSVTQHMTNYYLLKSFELNYNDAKYDIKSIFGENIPKSNDYLCESNK